MVRLIMMSQIQNLSFQTARLSLKEPVCNRVEVPGPFECAGVPVALGNRKSDSTRAAAAPASLGLHGWCSWSRCYVFSVRSVHFIALFGVFQHSSTSLDQDTASITILASRSTPGKQGAPTRARATAGAETA